MTASARHGPHLPTHVLALMLLSITVALIEHCSCFTSPPINRNYIVPPTTLTPTRLLASGDLTGLVEFASGGGALKLGAIIGKEGKKNLKILTLTTTLSVPPRSIKHIVPNGRAVTNEGQILEHEKAAAAALRDDIGVGGQRVSELWELMLMEVEDDPSITIDLTTLSELLLGDSTSISCYATRAVLLEGVENCCFKETTKGNTLFYEPRPSHVVETMRRGANVAAKEAKNWEELKQRIDDVVSNNEKSGDSVHITFDIEKETEEIKAALQSVERLACLATLNSEDARREEKAAGIDADNAIASAKQFLQNIGLRATAEVARKLLVSLNIWSKHTNLDLIRLKVPTSFGQSLEDAAADIASNPPKDLDQDSRMDLTHLEAYAIDEASTREIDDAISLEKIPTEYGDNTVHSRIWVHVADPSRYIELGSPLDQEARKRGTSIYLPTETIPMFPMSLAAGPLSLTGDISCALSVGIMLDEAGGIDTARPPIITPSLVKTTRITYDEVDELLDPFCMVDNENASGRCESIKSIENVESVIETLRQLEYLSEKRRLWRIDGGSLESIGPYQLPDMTVKAKPSADANDGWQVEVFAKRNYLANKIVSEFMLAANEAVAKYGDLHGLPMPFRNQGMDSVSDSEIESLPEGPCRSWLAIQSTTRSQISSDPLPHDGLGLDMYVQATSPVRRYADLALHHQVKCHLRGDALPFPNDNDGGDSSDTENIMMIAIAENANAISRQLERPANDYWLKEFLRRRGSQVTQVLVLSKDRYKDNVYKIFLPDLGAILSYKSTAPLVNGQQIDMQSLRLSELV